METNKDLILRSIQKFSELLDGLFKKGKNNEEMNFALNNFMIDEFDLSFDDFIKKSSEEITNILIFKNYNEEDIKELSNILYIKFRIENNKVLKKTIAEKAINMYNYYDIQSKTFCFDNKIKVAELSNFIKT